MELCVNDVRVETVESGFASDCKCGWTKRGATLIVARCKHQINADARNSNSVSQVISHGTVSITQVHDGVIHSNQCACSDTYTFAWGNPPPVTKVIVGNNAYVTLCAGRISADAFHAVVRDRAILTVTAKKVTDVRDVSLDSGVHSHIMAPDVRATEGLRVHGDDYSCIHLSKTSALELTITDSPRSASFVITSV